MIVLRDIEERDIDSFERFSHIPGMLNLSGDRDALRDKVLKSKSSFARELSNPMDSKFVFVAEDTGTGRVVGTSMIAAQHGTPEAPHFYFEVGSEQKFSETINTGFIHGTLKLKYDANGPSELGGLVMDPDYRNSEARVGRQISFVRFLFLGLNRKRFKNRILAELLPPLNKKGQSPLWEAIGRRFTSMDYWEADQLCAKSKEFIFSLFPSGKIYTTFLPAEARNAIGKVGKDTEPVVHMLKKIGFQYRGHVDPFDGGPHLWATVEDLLPIKKLARYPLGESLVADGASTETGLLCRAEQTEGFRAVSAAVRIENGQLRIVGESQFAEVTRTLSVAPGETLAFMPFY